MTTSRAALAATLAGVALTLAMAWPIVLAPATRIFGTEIDGRHHDAYTVMRQFAERPPPFPYRQPLVDDTGRALAEVIGPIPAYNLIVLASFPLTVLTTFLLGRYLGLSNIAASVAGFAFAFAPLHLAHAAYHPHTAQTQWIPLYFLGLLALLDRRSWRRWALVAAAAAALALSNLYGAFICAALTPVVLLRKWGQTPFFNWGLSPFFFAGLAFPAADLARYGAQWFAYLLPAVDHPLWGHLAATVWDARGMTGALVEQQVSLSWALLIIGTGLFFGSRSRKIDPSLFLIAVWFSLAPPAGSQPWWIPSTWIYPLLPMFRAYARFAFVAHLVLALLAGFGLMRLLERRADGSRARWRTAAAALLLLIATVEYAPLPARTHDVLPTEAHRWIADHGAPGPVLDCVAPSLGGTHMGWLMGRPTSALPPALPSCDEQQAATRAGALGFRYVIVRGAPDAGHGDPPAPGFVLTRAFDDSAVYEIGVVPAPLRLMRIDGFHRLERDADGAWRWMGDHGQWLLLADKTIDTTLELDLSAYQHARRLTLALDGVDIATIDVSTDRAWHAVGPLQIASGAHELTFTAVDPPSRAPAPDARDLSIQMHDWRWR